MGEGSRRARAHRARVRVLLADGAVRARPAASEVLRRLRRHGLGEVGSVRAPAPWPISALSTGARPRGFSPASGRSPRAPRRASSSPTRKPTSSAPRRRSARPASSRSGTASTASTSRRRTTSPSPFAPGERPIVFTGAMDYWPNVDAVLWFAREVLPGIRERDPSARFYVVGMNPDAAVRALASDPSVVVTGTGRRRSAVSPARAGRRGAAARSRAESRTRCSRRWRWRSRSS